MWRTKSGLFLKGGARSLAKIIRKLPDSRNRSLSAIATHPSPVDQPESNPHVNSWPYRTHSCSIISRFADLTKYGYQPCHFGHFPALDSQWVSEVSWTFIAVDFNANSGYPWVSISKEVESNNGCPRISMIVSTSIPVRW
jgi:hypothetical protein